MFLVLPNPTIEVLEEWVELILKINHDGFYVLTPHAATEELLKVLKHVRGHAQRVNRRVIESDADLGRRADEDLGRLVELARRDGLAVDTLLTSKSKVWL